MINTVTLNPALDYFVELSSLARGKTNRTTRSSITAGGKGINVSMMAKTLGLKSRATGFLAGFTGEEISRRILQSGIEDHFVHVDGMTRINIKIKEHLPPGSACETEINGDGLEILPNHLDSLFQKIENFPQGEFLVLSGRIPKSVSPLIYAKIMRHFESKNFRIVLDTTGDALSKALPEKPFLIKPNIDELNDFFSAKISDEEQMIFYCRKLQTLGAKNILLSLGADGAILLDEYGQVHREYAPKGTLIASSGAGDSMIAGFLKGYIEKDIAYALKLAVAAGSATAFSDGLANEEKVYQILQENRR